MINFFISNDLLMTSQLLNYDDKITINYILNKKKMYTNILYMIKFISDDNRLYEHIGATRDA